MQIGSRAVVLVLAMGATLWAGSLRVAAFQADATPASELSAREAGGLSSWERLADTLREMQEDVQSSISYAGGTKLMDIRKVNYVILGGDNAGEHLLM